MDKTKESFIPFIQVDNRDNLPKQIPDSFPTRRKRSYFCHKVLKNFLILSSLCIGLVSLILYYWEKEALLQIQPFTLPKITPIKTAPFLAPEPSFFIKVEEL